jgi:tRNA-splicing ligase RtcB
MQVFQGAKGGLIKAWIDGVTVEQQAREQLDNMASMPFIHKHVAIMPDCHWGMGATVGSVIPTLGAIIPAAVGVDIGCGMMAVRTSLTADQMPDNLSGLRTAIESRIPHGRTDNGGKNDKGAHNHPVLNHKDPIWTDLHKIVERHEKIESASLRAPFHIGTLGTGNHFVEICLDESNRVWIMLHSGSRGIGNRIGSYFIELAKQDMRKWFLNLPDENLAYFPQGTEHFGEYMKAVSWAQKFARLNREIMMAETIKALHEIVPVEFTVDEHAVNCHHNYVSEEKHLGAKVLLTRKGAVSAQEGELGIIPGSMGAKSFIVRGKGGEAGRQAFFSCSHGAGRSMSRNEARKRFTVEDHVKATEGVECRKDSEVIDETPMAYKDIDAVMAAQSDLVDIVHTLKQIVCVKG